MQFGKKQRIEKQKQENVIKIWLKTNLISSEVSALFPGGLKIITRYSQRRKLGVDIEATYVKL